MFVGRSVCLIVCLSVFLSIRPSAWPSVCRSVCLSVCLSVHVVSLSVCLCGWLVGWLVGNVAVCLVDPRSSTLLVGWVIGSVHLCAALCTRAGGFRPSVWRARRAGEWLRCEPSLGERPGCEHLRLGLLRLVAGDVHAVGAFAGGGRG